MKNLVLALCFLLVACTSTPPAPQEGALFTEAHLSLEAAGRKDLCCEASGADFAVAAGGPESAKIGKAIRAKGGNAVDVAVAVAFALAVERPQSAGVGGGGFMLVHNPGADPVFVDFRETAPHRASRDMFLDAQGKVVPQASTKGGKAVGVPGFVAGLHEAHSRWGKLSWREVVMPAAELAQKGFGIYPSLERAIRENLQGVNPQSPIGKIFAPKGKLLTLGDRLVQRDLSYTLKAVARGGRDEFYKGATGGSIVEAVAKAGGILEAQDLAHYEVRLRTPISWKWKGFTFYGAPPPSAGGILHGQMMGVLEGFDLGSQSQQPAAYTHLLAEVMKRAYADRSRYLGDPDHYAVPVQGLMGADRVKEIRERIDLSQSTPSERIAPPTLAPNNHGTTHLSVLDKGGSAVAMTLTINGPFGAGFVAGRTGVVMNNEMDDFSMKPGEKNLYGLTGGEANAVAPHKRPVSSMSPTVVLENGKPVLVVGGAGGSRILSSVFQVTLNYLSVFPKDVKKAVFAPRMHHQWLPDRLDLEPAYSAQSVEWLKGRGHTIAPPPFLPRVEAVGVGADGRLTAVSDPRDFGGAEAL